MLDKIKKFSSVVTKNNKLSENGTYSRLDNINAKILTLKDKKTDIENLLKSVEINAEDRNELVKMLEDINQMIKDYNNVTKQEVAGQKTISDIFAELRHKYDQRLLNIAVGVTAPSSPTNS